MAKQHSSSAFIETFLAEIGYSFVDDLISELIGTLLNDNQILGAIQHFQ